jgi:hypothetical protein
LGMILNLWLMRMNSDSAETKLSVHDHKLEISTRQFFTILYSFVQNACNANGRPTLASDLAKLEQKFVHEYREGASVFYVTTTNEDGKTQVVLEADKAAWGPIWNAKNDVFNTFLLSDPNLAHLTNVMFFVCDGNHRRQAWLNHIDRLHRNEDFWHYLVDSILLETNGKVGFVMQGMHNTNK